VRTTVHQHMKLAVALTGVLLALPAHAAHCPHGQIYRVHMRACVGVHTRLAREILIHPHYLHYPHHQPELAKQSQRQATPAPPEAPPTEPSAEVVKPEWPAPWKTYNQPRSTNGWRL
jgi:hypothetical protein